MKYPEKHPPLPSAPVLTVKIYTQSRQSYLKKMSLFHLICWQNFSIFFRLTPPPHPPYKTYIFLLNFKELIGVNLQNIKKYILQKWSYYASISINKQVMDDLLIFWILHVF